MSFLSLFLHIIIIFYHKTLHFTSKKRAIQLFNHFEYDFFYVNNLAFWHTGIIRNPNNRIIMVVLVSAVLHILHNPHCNLYQKIIDLFLVSELVSIIKDYFINSHLISEAIEFTVFTIHFL